MMQQAIAQEQLGQQQTMVQTQQQFQTPQIIQQQMLQQQNMLQQPQIVQQQQQMIQQQQQMQQQQLLQSQQQIVQGQPQQILQGQQIVQQQQNVQGQQQQQMLQGQQHIVQGQQIVQQMLQPHLGQQMLYCPTVRLVYDTSVLMQSGDQIQQQNQNIFVNQPPWARPVQNQVIYVQQLGHNLVPVQHLDPNLYLQQNMPMYQQVVQNVPQLVQNLPQTVQNVQQVRPIINNIPGLVQNFNTAVQNVPEQNVTQIQNIGFIPTNQDVNNTTSINNANNEAERQAANQINQQNAQNQELNQIYRQIVSQPQVRPMVQLTNQISNVQIAPQMGSQQTGTNIRHANNTANIPGNNAQSIRPNITQIAPNTMSVQNSNQNLRISNSNAQTGTNIVSNNVNNVQPIRHVMPNQVNFTPRSVQQNIVNTSVQSGNVITTVGSLNTVTYSAVRNGQPYTYRAIQPKQNTNVRINYTPRAQTPMVRKTAPNIVQNIVPNNVNNMNNVSHNVPVSTGYIKTEIESPIFNRKRKSESPDEVQKKISNYGSVTVTSQVKDKIKAKYGVHTSEIGINTSPIHKPKTENHPLLQINPMEAKSKQEVIKPPEMVNLTPVANIQPNVPVKKEATIEPSVKKDVSQQTEEKLVRKTVFPQATTRGRLLNDKVNLNVPKIEDVQPNIQTNINESNDVKMTEEICNKGNEIPVKLEEPKILPILPTNTKTEPIELIKQLKKESIYVVNRINDTLANIQFNMLQNQEVKPVLKKDIITKSETEDVEMKEGDKTILEKALNPTTEALKVEELTEKEVKVSETKINTDFDKVIKDNKIEKTEYTNITDISDKEIHIVDGSVHKEEKSKDYILTHVLDGYVIQESNVPFAIRKPLKEKTINTAFEEKSDPSMKNLTKEEMKDKILELSQLHIEDNNREKKDELKSENEEENIVKTSVEVENDEIKDPLINPFKDLKQNVVKTWTIEDLARHLTSHGWSETVALIQEHEIDGESLFLVTRTQLVTIGVNEGHAELICEFVGSKS